MKYMNAERYGKLSRGLFDTMIELKHNKERNLKAYEIAFQEVIEKIYPGRCWWQITDCKIFDHLLVHKNPEKTAIEILKQLKED